MVGKARVAGYNTHTWVYKGSPDPTHALKEVTQQMGCGLANIPRQCGCSGACKHSAQHLTGGP